MKMNKKTAVATSFCLGAIMLVTTAFADVASKSGYDQLKDSIKYTSKACSKDLKSFTAVTTMTLKDNDKVLFSNNLLSKYDNTQNRMERIWEYPEQKTKGYLYEDSKCSISSGENDIYYVDEFDHGNDWRIYEDRFEIGESSDLERIFDAVVGNIANYVMVEEKQDGSKQFSGTVTEAQIPALINAVSSYYVKELTNYNSESVPSSPMKPISDVVIKTVKGNAQISKDGLLESVLGSVIIAGKDKDGNAHELTLEILVKLEDINSTKVAKPDLKGKKVEKSDRRTGNIEITKKDVGTYKNDIVIVKDGNYEKIGERIVEIVNIEGQNLEGRYHEVYKDGYSDYSSKALDFRFDATIEACSNRATFKYNNSEEEIWFNTTGKGEIDFDFAAAYENRNYNNKFQRSFDN
jgi:hypothetical protein